LSVTAIGKEAFASCNKLKIMEIEWDSPLELTSADVFKQTDLAHCTLLVPQHTLSLYQSATIWKQFGTIQDAYVFCHENPLSFVSGGGTKNIAIRSDIAWTAVSNVSWLTVTPESGDRSGTLVVSVLANENNSSRNAVITLSGEGIETRTIPVFQTTRSTIQNYLKENTFWTDITTNTGYYDYATRYALLGDTIINETNYYKLYQDRQYIGALREEEKKIYLFSNICAWEKEVLLYDFSVSVGDIISNECDENYYVMKIDTVVLENGEERKRYYMGYDFYWIEGIGSRYGFLNPVLPTLPLIDHFITFLKCCKQEESVLYRDPIFCIQCPCDDADSEYSGSSDISIANRLLVTPNPAKGIVRVTILDANEKIYRFRLVTLSGSLLEKTETSTNHHDFNISSYPQGIYYVIAEYGNKRAFSKLIKN
jgi:hypothetical protein